VRRRRNAGAEEGVRLGDRVGDVELAVLLDLCVDQLAEEVVARQVDPLEQRGVHVVRRLAVEHRLNLHLLVAHVRGANRRHLARAGALEQRHVLTGKAEHVGHHEHRQHIAELDPEVTLAAIDPAVDHLVDHRVDEPVVRVQPVARKEHETERALLLVLRGSVPAMLYGANLAAPSASSTRGLSARSAHRPRRTVPREVAREEIRARGDHADVLVP
jgi:hypothetical protein